MGRDVPSRNGIKRMGSNFSHDATRNPREFRGTRPRYSCEPSTGITADFDYAKHVAVARKRRNVQVYNLFEFETEQKSF